MSDTHYVSFNIAVSSENPDITEAEVIALAVEHLEFLREQGELEGTAEWHDSDLSEGEEEVA